MNNGNRREFLNSGILGGGAGIAEKRSFRAVRTEYLTSPDYDPQYFETFPTAWAAGYAFRKVLDLPVKTGAEAGAFADEVSTAVEEWITLFLLHYFGVAHLAEFKQSYLQQNYDRDLWQALSGTYPSVREQAPRSLKLLQHNETVVGAYYPAVIFFPARDRTAWQKDKTLADYLLDDRLSWTRSRRILLTSDKENQDFHAHLRLIAEYAVSSRTLQDRLYDFCEANFKGRIDLTGSLETDPSSWEVPGLKHWESDELLQLYPLRKAKRSTEQDDEKNVGRIFYLLDGLPELQPWMKAATVPSGPAPYQYRKLNDKEIVVELPGRRFSCRISENDEIVLLKDLFLSDTPHWCKIPKTSDTQAAHIRSVHKMELRDPVVTEKDAAVCLAPIRSEFIRHFPEILTNLEKVSALPSLEGASVEWTIPVMPGREVKWQTRPSYAKGLAASSLAIWPPKVSSEWRLYAAYGFGTKEDSGRWHLVDQNGRLGKLVDVEEEEYVSVLSGSEVPNQPRALALTDNGERERGILFLADFGGDQTANRELDTKLSVDFGTSNTCLAYAFSDSQPEILRFTIAPRPVWGKRGDLSEALELPGFFPYKWNATTTKGFFPTILLSRRSDPNLTDALKSEDVSVAEIFKVDIPGLHRDLEQRLYQGDLNKTWKPHANLKWDLDGKTEPWRTLFLQLTLLYAHAEMFFSKRMLIDRYVFTFPLAFRKDDRDSYHNKVRQALKRVRNICYGTGLGKDVNYEEGVDESTAIAESIGSVGNKATMEVFVDVGGGTADIAVSHDRRFLVLDSIRVAGKTFFQFAKKNFGNDLLGASEFKKHLRRLLQGANDDAELKLLNPDPSFDLDITYSVWISSLNDQQFQERESAILRKGMGTQSYQRYRTRLFFQHILAYALLQACAAAVEQKLKPSSGINLILGGNGWGLMLFGEFKRLGGHLEKEAKRILNLLKEKLAAVVTEEEREYLEALKIYNLILLNEENLSKAKTNVALGALNAARTRASRDGASATPYAGFTLEGLELSGSPPATIRWCERWGTETFEQKFPGVEQVENGRFDAPADLEVPLSPVLSVFTSIGNVRAGEEDNMPGEAWTNINGRVDDFVSTLSGRIERLEVSPINHFLSEVFYSRRSNKDFLDTLAQVNGNYRVQSKES
ncbi:MAG TPA: hypothetical protein VFX97_03490 [Pyrinomonadaceae bacterium]|nr:hypothetical protein [Pyrinomonadaceae bacterium]